jgi:4-hydroxybutyryl-CoA dehydratase / vinylacetyl-CoA-Delta-isomerase
MAMRTADEYLASIKDGRTIWHHGQQVADQMEVDELRVAAEHGARDYAHALEDPELFAAKDPDTGEAYSAFYRIPRSAEDVHHRSKMIEVGTAEGATVVPLIKEIGTDGIFAMLRVLEGEGRERAEAFWQRCRDEDLALALAQTDVKGDRSKPPHQQTDPDLYLHVVDEDAEGITVRGAKVHTTNTCHANELLVFPTRAMGAEDTDWAVAFAVPVDSPGLTLYASPFNGREGNQFEFPISTSHKDVETLTVFEDVKVPWERVFLYKEPEKAGPLALTFVEYHRFTAVSYKLPLVDLMVGAAAQIAEMNGTIKAGHIKDKLTHLIAYAETVRALTEMAANRTRVGQHDIAYPDPMTTNLAKFTFATGYHEHVEMLQDIAGGLLVTGPSGADWDSPDVRPVLEKYFQAAVPAEPRLRMMHLISDLTARDLGGWHAVLAVHAEGSIEAEKMQILRSYDPRSAVAYARKLAGLD